MPSAEVNGVRLNYLQVEEPGPASEREDLIMVHGLATNMAFWYLPYAPVFAKRFRVTLFDLRVPRPQRDDAFGGYTPQNLALRPARADGPPRHRARAFRGSQLRWRGGAEPGPCLDASRICRAWCCADTHISAVRRHQASSANGATAPTCRRVLDRHGPGSSTRTTRTSATACITEVAHLPDAPRRRCRQDLLDLVGPMMAQARQAHRVSNGCKPDGRHRRPKHQLMGDDGLSLEALRRLMFPVLALYGDHSQARLTGGELLDVWPHAEFRRVRDAGHFFPASRPDDVMYECERFWRGEFARKAGGTLRRRAAAALPQRPRLQVRMRFWHFTTREQQHIGPVRFARRSA